ncbi:MAG: imidazole glycerol phosphate synthase subunit HisH [Beijerinckiaceae bacterium]|nr:imidazole glycerol phosphate synthase subunit HisH [Beijerinckiaceae bacterium]
MRVAIIDYGSGNLHSAQKAFEKAAKSEGITGDILLTSDPDEIRAADRIVLPGVGAFGDCKAGLVQAPGVLEAMTESVLHNGRPFLGICVGMQLLAVRGLEHGTHKGLGWLDGEVQAITPDEKSLKVPHMGWNNLIPRRSHFLLNGINLGEVGLHAYFVHSYQFIPGAAQDIIAVCDYGGPIVAMVGKDNIAGTQFHPEKSQKLGLALIANFLRWKP